jgi:citrate synthase
MRDKNTWTTSVTDVKPGKISYRGIPVEEMMGGASYGGATYLLLTGAMPTPAAARLLEAVLVSSMDHGTTPPSTLAARTAASTGAPLNAAVAAGILSINEYHGGAIERCAAHLREVAEVETNLLGPSPGEFEAPPKEIVREAAREIVERHRRAGRRLAGFGHRVHPHDPRAARLLALAEEEGAGERWIARARALEQALVDASGKQLPLNVDGAIAVVVLALELPREAANGLFMIARLPGLIAHVLEERSTQRPMRRIDPNASRYAGAERPRDA